MGSIAAGLAIIVLVLSPLVAGVESVPSWTPLVAATVAGVYGLWFRSRPVAADDLRVETVDETPPLAHRLIDAIGDPLLIADERRRIVLANDASLELLGRHVVGEDVRVALRHPAAAALLMADAPAKGQTVELIGLGGGEGHWELILASIGQGEQLIRLIDRSKERALERSRVDFVANASHELRTPLATLLGFVETLEGPAADDSKARGRFLAIMHGEARRMTRLIDDLLSLSRIETEKHRAPTEAIAVAALAEEVRSAHAHAAGKGEIRVVAQDGTPAAQGDRDQLLQLLHNLVGNAVKYGRPGGVVTISVECASTAEVRLSVADEGEGIPAEHLPRLTERFYRVDSSRSRALGGTGLGLAIVKHIVERHRGRLAIDSEPGKGTRVSVLLPVAGNMSKIPGAVG